ncbi:TPA: aldose 1-epimerase family protein, partial [Listeria innocua]
MIKLENELLLVEMKEAGAELTRIFHKDTKLEYLWNADSAFWGRHSPVL